MKKKYKGVKMVNWFEPSMLLQTAIKAVISNLFGNYADRREMQAALPENSASDWDKLYREYTDRKEIWVDFISDTGDGFNSTYSIAKMAAQPELIVDVDGKARQIPRGKILIMGGDQIYPTPTGEMYDNKFRMPFEAALPATEREKYEKEINVDRPHMYAIPGNHDWYDGLGNFLKIFCQKRSIGIWKTHQSRSYFAVPLPHNYWLWATDIQLNQDIDKPQQEYFCEIAKTRMKPGDNVILVTAEPAWLYKQLYVEDKSYERFKFFINRYIIESEDNKVGHYFRLAVVLTGDFHHYTHYCSEEEHDHSHHYFGAGGGGSFLHLTHYLPEKLDKLDEKNIRLTKSFPDKKDSYALLLGNLAFPLKNYYFSFVLLGTLYFLFFWLLQSPSIITPGENYMQTISNFSFSNFFERTGRVLLGNPMVGILSFVIVFGIFKFTDVKTGNKGAIWFGLLHALLQCLCIFGFIWVLANIHSRDSLSLSLANWYWPFIIAAELIIGGGLIGGFIMGLYLLLSNLWFGAHIDEASSSLASPDFKNFIRMHIDEKGLTIYPIGIRKISTEWEHETEEKTPYFEGKLPEYHLIEKPVFIKK